MLRPCSAQPCGALVASGRCEAHRKAAQKARGTTKERGYDSDWERVRLFVLARDGYICQVRVACKGAVATEANHIVPIEQRPDLRLDPENAEASCKACNVALRNSAVRSTVPRGYGRDH